MMEEIVNALDRLRCSSSVTSGHLYNIIACSCLFFSMQLKASKKQLTFCKYNIVNFHNSLYMQLQCILDYIAWQTALHQYKYSVFYA